MLGLPGNRRLAASLIVAVGLFFLGALASPFINPQTLFQEHEVVGNPPVHISPIFMSPLEIFALNALAILGVFLNPVLGLISPFLQALSIGNALQSHGAPYLLSILPHGLIEVPAILLTNSALYMAVSALWSYPDWKEIRKVLTLCGKIVLVSILLLYLASWVEYLATPVLIEALIGQFPVDFWPTKWRFPANYSPNPSNALLGVGLNAILVLLALSKFWKPMVDSLLSMMTGVENFVGRFLPGRTKS